MIALPDEMVALKRFHGHLGPYAVLGYRMGLTARRQFPERIYARVHSGTKRPLSCLSDGVQMSSCCTLGKNNIMVLEEGEARVEFSDGKTGHLEMTARSEVVAEINTRCDHHNEEEMAMRLYSMRDDELWTVTSGSSTPFGR
ncbi:MAG: formylmethanofuran dehydrogenase subunit E family protein [Methanomassiliicoccus sp.]|nr:formylmethanofuran dehydrogenase subunit E family protein [Methanomassiliicoccus sp.]